jgi:hypothetical protein
MAVFPTAVGPKRMIIGLIVSEVVGLFEEDLPGKGSAEDFSDNFAIILLDLFAPKSWVAENICFLDRYAGNPVDIVFIVNRLSRGMLTMVLLHHSSALYAPAYILKGLEKKVQSP